MGFAGARVWQPHPDPRFKVRHDRRRQAPFGRHAQFGIGAADGLDQPALRWIARNQDRPMLAALAYAIARIKAEAALELLGLSTMARIALVDQNRSDLPLEMSDAL